MQKSVLFNPLRLAYVACFRLAVCFFFFCLLLCNGVIPFCFFYFHFTTCSVIPFFCFFSLAMNIFLNSLLFREGRAGQQKGEQWDFLYLIALCRLASMPCVFKRLFDRSMKCTKFMTKQRYTSAFSCPALQTYFILALMLSRRNNQKKENS